MTHRDPDLRPPARPAPVALSGPDQMLAALPHLIGFAPRDSLVVLVATVEPGHRSGHLRGELVSTLRIDLPSSPEEVEQVVETVGWGVARRRAGRPGADGQPTVAHAFLVDATDEVAAVLDAALADRLATGPTPLHTVLSSRDGQVRALRRAEEPVEEDWAAALHAWDVPAVADMVLEGRGFVGSREELEARVLRRDDRGCAAAVTALGILRLDPGRHDPEAALAALGRWVVDGDPEPTHRERAHLALALTDVVLRDAVMARWLPDVFSLELVDPGLRAMVTRALPVWPEHGRDAALDRLVHLAAGTPEPLLVPLLTVLASVAWGHGHGALANIAVDRALELDPGYRMAVLLEHALRHAVDPRAMGAGRRAGRRGHAA